MSPEASRLVQIPKYRSLIPYLKSTFAQCLYSKFLLSKSGLFLRPALHGSNLIAKLPAPAET